MTVGRFSVMTPRPARHRGVTALAAALAAGVLVAGCAPRATSASAPPTDGATSDAPTASSGDFTPITIEHRYGTTEVTERPERIVSLDAQWTDTLVALGAPPVGFAADTYYDGDFYPWLGDALADSTRLEFTDAISYEQVAALEPDLIVISWAAQDQGIYDDLAAIAPTVTSLSDAVVDPWQDITVAAGELLGETDRAAQLISDVGRQIADVATELPDLAGKTFAFANYLPGDQIYVLTDPADGAIAFFLALGLELPEGLIGGEAPPGGRYEISFEQIGLLDADVLILLTNGADTSEITGFDQLRAVQDDAYVVLDYAGATALNVPSALSLPFGIDAVLPALEAAASPSGN